MGANFFFRRVFFFGANIELKESIKEGADAEIASDSSVDDPDDARNLANDVGTSLSDTKEGTETLPKRSDDSNTWAASSFIKLLSIGSVTDG